MTDQDAAAGQPAHPDPFWQAVVNFLDRHGVPRNRTVAPSEFGEALAGSIPYGDATESHWKSIDAVVIHKGWTEQLPMRFLSALLQRFLPGFANEVFVVYTRNAIEAIESPDHVRAFLEQIQRSGPDQPRQKRRGHPLMVYCGNDRVICRDPDFRKIMVPSQAQHILAAFADGRNVIREIRNALAGAISDAQKVVHLGAGIGLLALACQEEVAPNAVHVAVEEDGGLAPVLVANINLAGMFWRTELITAMPERLLDLEAGAAGRPRQSLHGVQENPHFNRPCDLVHMDLGFDLWPRAAQLPEFLARNGFPDVVLSTGLCHRATGEHAVDTSKLRGLLTQAGYEETAPGSRSTIFELAIFRHGGQPDEG